MGITFREILNQKSWSSYEDYIAEGENTRKLYVSSLK
jgi:hypothetical protein